MAFRYSHLDPPQPAVHGGTDGETVVRLDFSVNTNPLGPPAGLVDAVRSADHGVYPDRHFTAIKDAGGIALGYSPEQVLFGAGTAEIIYRLSAALLGPGDTVLVATPTFSEFSRSARLRGATVHEVPLYRLQEGHGDIHEDNGLDVTALVEEVRRLRPVLCWICHPNNPTGHAWSDAQLRTLAAVCGETETQLCIDAAYVDTGPGLARDFPRDALVLRSPTKSFGIPGIRLGIATGPAALVAHVESYAPPWVIGSGESATATWIFSASGHAFLKETVPLWKSARDDLMASLAALGWTVFASAAPFFVIRIPEAEALRVLALASGIRLRSLTDFGLADGLRMAARTPAENATLLSWLKESTWKSG